MNSIKLRGKINELKKKETNDGKREPQKWDTHTQTERKGMEWMVIL